MANLLNFVFLDSNNQNNIDNIPNGTIIFKEVSDVENNDSITISLKWNNNEYYFNLDNRAITSLVSTINNTDYKILTNQEYTKLIANSILKATLDNDNNDNNIILEFDNSAISTLESELNTSEQEN